MSDISKAKELLHQGELTCVLCCKDKIFTSSRKGIKPLVAFYESGEDFSGYSAADKVVGRGAAFMYVLLGVKKVYAAVLSRPAREVFAEYGIEAEYGEITDNIINRRGDGICPFEEAVLGICDSREAYKKIRLKMAELNIT